MTTFVCIHGAGGRGAWRWVGDRLAERGHRTVAPDLPCDDEEAGLQTYVDSVLAAVPDDVDGVVVVGQSLGGFTAPLVADRLPTTELVLVTAMVPVPGETGAAWWEDTGHGVAMAAGLEAAGLVDPSEEDLFVHDVPADRLAAAGEPRASQGRVMEDPWPLAAWPDVVTRFVVCTEDRFFPPAWMRSVVADRLPGASVDELAAGHCPHLSVPDDLADLLVAGPGS